MYVNFNGILDKVFGYDIMLSELANGGSPAVEEPWNLFQGSSFTIKENANENPYRIHIG